MIQINIQKELKGKSGELQLVVNQNVEQGEIIGLFGESGAGKTSLLRIIAGLDLPSSGTIEFNEAFKNLIIKDKKQRVLSGFMFQDYSLFPNKTVLQNLEYALSKDRKEEAKEMLELLDLNLLSNRYPKSLSGGQQQRVAFGRALLVKSKLFLLDEPFSALDMTIKDRLIQFLKNKVSEEDITVFISSHNLMDLSQLSTKIWNIEDGKVSISKVQNLISSNIQQQGIIEQVEGNKLHISSSGKLFEIKVEDSSEYSTGQVVFLHADDVMVKTL